MDVKLDRSRRDLLKLAGAGAAAAGVAVLSAPASVLAVDPPVNLDFTNTGTGTTTVESPTTDSPNAAFLGRSSADQVGVYGFSGASGDAPDAPFILTSEFPAGAGVYGMSEQTDGNGVVGASFGAGGFENGVFGIGTNGVFGVGYWGTYGLSTGTLGVGATGDAASDAIGVYGWTGDDEPPVPAAGGVGVYARAQNPTLTALQVVGKAKFSRSGTATVAANKKSVVVTLVGTTTTSLVFAMLGKLVAGRYVAAVVPAAGSFTIHLNGKVTAPTKVNWVVFDK